MVTKGTKTEQQQLQSIGDKKMSTTAQQQQQQQQQDDTSTNTRKKVVVVGDGNCGKTCLLMSFIQNEMPDTYIPTVFETYVTELQFSGTQYEISLYDTAGQDAYDRLRPLSYPDTDVMLVCFAIDSQDSFYNAYDKWVPEVQHFRPNTPFVLVGTKSDLRDDTNTLTKLKKIRENPVTTEEGEEMAERTRAAAYVECSAYTRHNIKEVLQTAVSASLHKKKNNKKLMKMRQLRCNFL